MDLRKFLSRLGAEPRSTEARILNASRSTLDHARLYAQAQEFENKLEDALRVPVDAGVAESVLAGLNLKSQPSRSRGTTWLTMAASILVVVGLASVLLPDWGPDAAVKKDFIAHLEGPEPALSARQDISDERLLERFAQRGVALRNALPDVTYFSPCVIGGTPGVHVVMTDSAQKQMTFMLMPGRDLEQELNYSLGDMTVRMADTQAGVVALFGHQGQNLGGAMRALLRNIDGPNRRVAASPPSPDPQPQPAG